MTVQRWTAVNRKGAGQVTQLPYMAHVFERMYQWTRGYWDNTLLPLATLQCGVLTGGNLAYALGRRGAGVLGCPDG